MIDYKPIIKPFMNVYDRIKWMNEISHGISTIEKAHDAGILSDQSFFDWMYLRNAELAWNEFYMPTIKLSNPPCTRHITNCRCLIVDIKALPYQTLKDS